MFNMLFEFSHVDLPLNESEIWCYPVKWTLRDLKHALSSSQHATARNGWCPVFFENHDQPRSVNHFFPEGADTQKAAKVLATVLLTLRGTPFIYQGQELGMSNVSWPDINTYDDISTKGQYAFALNEGFSPEEAMKFVHYFSRDNARTPMQWDNSPNAGFSTARSWLPVNENYITVNARTEEQNPDSVLSWYRRLAEFRRNHEELTAGDYREIMTDSEEVFAFERMLDGRRIITAANFSLESAMLPEEFAEYDLLLSSESDAEGLVMRPLEARIMLQYIKTISSIKESLS